MWWGRESEGSQQVLSQDSEDQVMAEKMDAIPFHISAERGEPKAAPELPYVQSDTSSM